MKLSRCTLCKAKEPLDDYTLRTLIADLTRAVDRGDTATVEAITDRGIVPEGSLMQHLNRVHPAFAKSGAKGKG